METHAPPRVLKVLFLAIHAQIGGAERLVLELASKLDRARFAPSVGWFADEQPPGAFRDLGVPLFPLRKRAGFDWNAVRTLADIIRTHRVDVINAHHFMPFFYAISAATLARAGVIYTEHSEADVFRVGGVWRPIGAVLLRRADAVVGVSERVSAAMRSHFWLDWQRVHTIENGVVLRTFEHTDACRVAARNELGLDAADFVIGHVANFRRNKNHLFLLRAFLKAFLGRTDVKLLLVGQGFAGDPENSEPEIAAFVRDHGLGRAVHLLGYRPDVPKLLGAMDVFSLVSYKEGLPLSVLEAMASSLPVVVSDIDGLKDVVQADVNGMLVAPDDVDGLARVLSRLYQERALARRLGDSGRRIAREKYSFAKCLSATQELLSRSAIRASVRGGVTG